MKTTYLGTISELGSQARTELRQVARMHLLSLQELIESGNAVATLSVGFKPGRDDEGRGYMFIAYSISEMLRFYVSPGRRGRFIADKIDFEYKDGDGSAILLDVSREPWANALYEKLERSGVVNEEISRA